MRVAVVGAGAMGSVYAGLLASAGNAVSVVDVDLAHVEAIRRHGLSVEGASGKRVVRVEATSNAADVGIVDLVVIATKAMDAKPAATGARLLIGPETTVVTIQNGLGAADAVAEAIAPDHLMIGVAGGFGASVIGPGRVHHHGMELMRFGEYRGPTTARTEAIAETWREAGFTVKTFDDIEKLIWEKLICNVCYSGVCGLLELTVGEVMSSPHAWAIAGRCAAEALEVGLACGVDLEIDDAETYVREFGQHIRGARPSLLLDLLANRRTEIEWINGAIPRKAATLTNRNAPTNELITTLVLAKEAARVRGRESGPPD